MRVVRHTWSISLQALDSFAGGGAGLATRTICGDAIWACERKLQFHRRKLVFIETPLLSQSFEPIFFVLEHLLEDDS